MNSVPQPSQASSMAGEAATWEATGGRQNSCCASCTSSAMRNSSLLSSQASGQNRGRVTPFDGGTCHPCGFLGSESRARITPSLRKISCPDYRSYSGSRLETAVTFLVRDPAGLLRVNWAATHPGGSDVVSPVRAWSLRDPLPAVRDGHRGCTGGSAAFLPSR